MRWRCYRLGRRDSGGCVGRYGSGFRVTLELPRVLFDLINQRSPRIFTSIISLWLYFLSILSHLFLFYMFFLPCGVTRFLSALNFLSFFLSIDSSLSLYLSFLFQLPYLCSRVFPTPCISCPPHSFVVFSFSLPSFPMFLSSLSRFFFAFLPSLRVFSLNLFYCISLILPLPSHFQTFYQMNVCMFPINA